jgi:hypothetical protein
MQSSRLLRRTAGSLAHLTRSESLLGRSFTTTPFRRKSAPEIDENAVASLPGLDPSKLTVTESITPKKPVPPEELIFGRTFTGLPLPWPEPAN